MADNNNMLIHFSVPKSQSPPSDSHVVVHCRLNIKQRGKKEVEIVLRDNLDGWMDKRIGKAFIANLSMYFMLQNT